MPYTAFIPMYCTMMKYTAAMRKGKYGTGPDICKNRTQASPS